MTTSKWIFLFSALLCSLRVLPVIGQEPATEDKSEIKIIIIEETTDRYGHTTRTKTIREGTFSDEEIDAIIEEETEALENTRVNRSPFDQARHGKGGYLGVTIENTDDGVRITEVQEGSAADKAGLVAGDILTAVDDASVKDVEELVKAVSSYEAGTSVQVAYTREGDAHTTEATLGQRQVQRDSWEEDLYEKVHKFKHKPHEQHKPKAEKPRFGVGIDDAEEGGSLVTGIYEGSVAESAGLQEGDIITIFNGAVIGDSEALIMAVREAPTDQEIVVQYIRDGETHTTTAAFEK
jgi:S1-C subfamily serine protease